MKVAIYSINNDLKSIKIIDRLINFFKSKNITVLLEEKLSDFVSSENNSTFNSYKQLDKDTDIFIALGGDGTVLRSLNYVRQNGTPILGVNTGRLGFLASISENDIHNSLNDIVQKKYTIETRQLIEVKLEQCNQSLNNFPLALNEVSLSRENTTSMITIHTKINDDYLNVFWADGLVIATPTGSTGYSMSSGGPIISPSSKSFVITPIAPHNLNARPLVLDDNDVITIHVEGRAKSHNLSLDTRIYSLPMNTSITIKKPEKPDFFVRPNNYNFFETLRNKLFWGFDNRN
ncbi:MAG: NAD kinase [Bacteroidota bacterium]|nr:NAD kinase [Bacteroidota bacterium]